MNQFLSLYWNELKNIYKGLLIIMVIIVVYMLYGDFFLKPSNVMRPSLIELCVLQFGDWIFCLFPLLFVYTLYKEENLQSFHQFQPIPVKKHIILFIKFSVIFDAMIVMILIIAAYAFIMNHFHPRADNKVIIGGLYSIFDFPFIILSLVCTAWGAMKIVKRFRPVAGLAVVVSGLLLYLSLKKLSYPIGNTFFESLLAELFSTLFIGFIFCGAGVVLYKKFGEV